MKTMPQLEIICESYSSRKLTYLVDHYGTSGSHARPHYSHIWDRQVWNFKNILEGSKSYHN
jgi:hypothetical protein